MVSLFARNPSKDESDEPIERAVAAQGNIEAIRQGAFTGWAVAMLEGKSVPLLEVRILHESGEVLGRGFATEYRRDVQEAGLPTGWCGFTLPHAALLPTEGAITLQALVESTWIMVSQVAVDAIPSDVSLGDTAISEDHFSDLLSVFAGAKTTGGLIGKGTMRLGTDVWIQASSADADTTRAVLRLEPTERAHVERAFLRVEAADGTFGRVDVRFRLQRPVEATPAVTLKVSVRTLPVGDGTVKVNIYRDNAREALSTYRVTTGSWAELEALLPEIALTPGQAEDSLKAVWIEVVGSDLQVLDVSEPRIVAVADSPFESVVVGAQAGVIVSSGADDGGDARAVEDFTVVIPFYGNHAYTGHCVEAVLMNSAHRPHVVLVDDGSPRTGHQFLGPLRERVSLVRFSSNRGYTAAVNAGVLAAKTPKVVILNNDTRVLPGWDEPLLAALDEPGVFAAGPLSNAASYQSVPEYRGDSGWAVNEYPWQVKPRLLAEALRREFGTTVIDWPIVNGFCYAVRGSAFIDLGMLDQLAFPRGYGEEVDLMLRGRREGLRNVIVPGSFVYHYKSKTFSGERAALSSAANVVLAERWGDALPDAVAEMDYSTDLLEVRDRIKGIFAELTTGESA